MTGKGLESVNFGHQVNSDSFLVCFNILFIGIKKINHSNSENPDETAHKETAHLDFHYFANECPNLYYVRSYLTLPYLFSISTVIRRSWNYQQKS